jgi:predicted RNase H-like HicB family nuclease
MMVPTIHLNGTSKEELMEQLQNAARALSEAIQQLGEACPNARDYYPQGDQAFHAAAKEHAVRLMGLVVVLKELERLLDAIDDGGFKGEARG